MIPSGASLGLRLVVDDDDRVDAALWRRYRAEPVAGHRNALFDRYTRNARRFADDEFRRFGEVGLDRADCRQLAMEALLHSIERFDIDRGSQFESYLRQRVRGQILNALSKASESGAQYGYRQRTERERLRSLRNAQDDAANVEDQVESVRAIASQIALGLIIERRSRGDLEAIEDSEPSAYETLAWRQLVRELDRKLVTLPERERFVLDHHYRQDVSFAQIAMLLGLSKGRVSQLHAQALARLRRQMARLK